jgi:hypothetical protein
MMLLVRVHDLLDQRTVHHEKPGARGSSACSSRRHVASPMPAAGASRTRLLRSASALQWGRRPHSPSERAKRMSCRPTSCPVCSSHVGRMAGAAWMTATAGPPPVSAMSFSWSPRPTVPLSLFATAAPAASVGHTACPAAHTPGTRRESRGCVAWKEYAIAGVTAWLSCPRHRTWEAADEQRGVGAEC